MQRAKARTHLDRDFALDLDWDLDLDLFLGSDLDLERDRDLDLDLERSRDLLINAKRLLHIHPHYIHNEGCKNKNILKTYI